MAELSCHTNDEGVILGRCAGAAVRHHTNARENRTATARSKECLLSMETGRSGWQWQDKRPTTNKSNTYRGSSQPLDISTLHGNTFQSGSLRNAYRASSESVTSNIYKSQSQPIKSAWLERAGNGTSTHTKIGSTTADTYDFSFRDTTGATNSSDDCEYVETRAAEHLAPSTGEGRGTCAVGNTAATCGYGQWTGDC